LSCANKTQATLTFVQSTIPRTHIALDATVLKKVPVAARFALNDLIHGADDLSFQNKFKVVIGRALSK
jgi:hypothetical protein